MLQGRLSGFFLPLCCLTCFPHRNRVYLILVLLYTRVIGHSEAYWATAAPIGRDQESETLVLSSSPSVRTASCEPRAKQPGVRAIIAQERFGPGAVAPLWLPQRSLLHVQVSVERAIGR